MTIVLWLMETSNGVPSVTRAASFDLYLLLCPVYGDSLRELCRMATTVAGCCVICCLFVSLQYVRIRWFIGCCCLWCTLLHSAAYYSGSM